MLILKGVQAFEIVSVFKMKFKNKIKFKFRLNRL